MIYMYVHRCVIVIHCVDRRELCTFKRLDMQCPPPASLSLSLSLSHVLTHAHTEKHKLYIVRALLSYVYIGQLLDFIQEQSYMYM